MGYALQTWAWACALTGFQFLLTSTAAPTSSTLSLSRLSNFLNRFPCVPALTHSLKPSIFPISTSCTNPPNTTLQNDPVDAFWAWPPFALFSMEDYSPKVRTPSLPANPLSTSPTKPARSSTPYSKKPTTTPQSPNGGGTSSPPTTPPPPKKTTSPSHNDGPQPPSTLHSNPPSSARASKTRRAGCGTSPRA